ncbi:hypothetical protein NDU88_008346 [Pleurodeles waltl]|uniref:Uncharacterized protein n=1 Tax=Pleurodeles waltl TaxID=8319 RepID=A0AAV7QUD7_PLEWA|nr:hypothetical protein NDU88_008346 [Pleurodeles waltl]
MPLWRANWVTHLDIGELLPPILTEVDQPEYLQLNKVSPLALETLPTQAPLECSRTPFGSEDYNSLMWRRVRNGCAGDSERSLPLIVLHLRLQSVKNKGAYFVPVPVLSEERRRNVLIADGRFFFKDTLSELLAATGSSNWRQQ